MLGIALLADEAACRAAPAAHRGLTLRTKGTIGVAALIVYVALVGLYVTHERAKLLHIVQQIEQVRHNHELLSNVEGGLMHCVSSLQKRLNTSMGPASYDDVQLDFTAVSAGLARLKTNFPESAPLIGRLERDLAGLVEVPARETALALHDDEVELLTQVGTLESAARENGEGLAQAYRALNSEITVKVVVSNLLGFALFAGSAIWFFSRLASDVRRLEERAVAIVEGYRGAPLDVTRGDEIGCLMRSVNRMQTELRLREQRQDISREQRFHQERMALIGSLAATVAHEVSNPINSISGLAQHTIESIRAGRRPADAELTRHAQMVVGEAERIGAILRQLADFGAHRSAVAEAVDVNELARTTCSLVRYDRRFADITLTLETDPDTSAVHAVADHVTQVMMNLLINAADATESLSDGSAEIRVSTRSAPDGAVLEVRDNGHGMTPEVLAHAFEQYFTTKPAGKGRGIGLFLSKALISEGGGRIDLESVPGAGTRARVFLPAQTATKEM